jgi:thymidylate kinase
VSTPSANGPAIIILTGPPGSGKTTTGEILASKSTTKSVHMRADNFFDWVRAGFIPPDDPKSMKQNQTVLTAAAVSAIAYWRGGYEVIVDGIIGPWFLPIFHAAFMKAQAPAHYVVLRASPEVAIARAMTRNRSETEREMEAIRSLHQAFGNLGPLEAHVVDTSFITADHAARDLRNALPSGRFLLRAPQASLQN